MEPRPRPPGGPAGSTPRPPPPRRPPGSKIPSFLRPSKPSILPGGVTQMRGPGAKAAERRPLPAHAGVASGTAGPARPPPVGRPASTTPRPVAKPAPAPAPERNYAEYRLVSGKKGEGNFYLMKFQSNKTVNPGEFVPPLKLRRRDRGTIQQMIRASQLQAASDAAAAAGGTSGDAGPSQPANASGAAPEPEPTPAPPPTRGRNAPSMDTTVIAPYGGATRNRQNLFKKRTKQIYLADDAMRKLRETESKPWLLEDFDRQELWTGALEGGQTSSYVMFVLIEDGFKVVPSSKWYRFQPRPQYATLSIDEAEEQIKLAEKEESSRWLMKKRVLRPEGEAGAAVSSGGSTSGLGRLRSLIDTPGRGSADVEELGALNFQTVDDTPLNYESGDDDAKGGRRGRGPGSDGDEMDFDDVFQDDEEGGGEYEPQDDEAREAAERVKKEVQKFSTVHSDAEDDDDDAFEDVDQGRGDQLGADGKQLKHLVRDLEKNKAYESDHEDDPYASDDDLFEDVEEAMAADSPASGKDSVSGAAAVKPEPGTPVISAASKKKDVAVTTAAAGTPASAKKRKRTTTVATASPGVATPTAKTSARKPTGEGSVAGGDAMTPTIHPEAKKPRVQAAAAAGDPDQLTEEEVTQCIRTNRFNTRELIGFFKRKLKANPANAELLKTFVRKVATTRNNILELKDEFR
ncbi:transcription factor IIF subunit tfg1 [Tieghemiomyces parasiticus]|uniref:Transcription initiation factor IIF subunit alpha n=1 Tax=Tieghemiomyces parasiticus TaxID=78921 RepID=A0A9W8A521_9FUNG|nr:transcription factor IIF subunit tfg1 [Tieghemiomyces parasiticus]